MWQVWCSSIQGIYVQLMGVDLPVHLPLDLPSLVYQYSRHLCLIDEG